MKIDEKTGKVILEISHSGLNSFNSCSKLWAFRKVITNFETDREESDATGVGTAMHEGIQTYMLTRDVDKAIEALALHHPIELKYTSKASEYSLEASVWTLLQFIEHSEITAYEVAQFNKDGVEIPGVELAFLVVIELEHVIFHLRGFIDLILRSPWTGEYMPWDIKTTTPQALATIEPKYQWDWQVTSYGIPLNALLGNDGPFRTGIAAIIMSDREPVFKSPLYPRNAEHVREYEYYLLDNCKRIQEYLLREHFPRNPSSCIRFGKVCHYHDKCGASSLADMQALVNPSGKEGDRKDRPFNPVFEIHIEGAK